MRNLTREEAASGQIQRGQGRGARVTDHHRRFRAIASWLARGIEQPDDGLASPERGALDQVGASAGHGSLHIRLGALLEGGRRELSQVAVDRATQASKTHGGARVLRRLLLVFARAILDDLELDVLLLVEEGVQPPDPFGLDVSLLQLRRGVALALQDLRVRELEFVHLGNELGDQRGLPRRWRNGHHGGRPLRSGRREGARNLRRRARIHVIGDGVRVRSGGQQRRFKTCRRSAASMGRKIAHGTVALRIVVVVVAGALAVGPHPVAPLLPAPPRLLVHARHHLRLQRVALRPVLIELLAQRVDLLLELAQSTPTGEIRLRRLRLELLELLQQLRVLIREECEIRGRDRDAARVKVADAGEVDGAVLGRGDG